jgi:hypothetical protein
MGTCLSSSAAQFVSQSHEEFENRSSAMSSAMSSRIDPPALEDHTNATLANSTDPPQKRAKRTTHVCWQTRKTTDGEEEFPETQLLKELRAFSLQEFNYEREFN